MLRSLLFLYTIIYGINLSIGNVRRKRTLYRLGPPEDHKGSKDPSVLLQLTPGFFDYPGLQDIYAALSGNKISQDVYLQLAPRKREAKIGDEAEFALRVNPGVPRNPMSVRKFNNTKCEEQKISWCVEAPTTTPLYCPPIDTPTPIPTTCGPMKPASMMSNCVASQSRPPLAPKDPCEECPKVIVTSTPFSACKSVPPPTAALRLKYCSPTTIPCHAVPCTYRRLEAPGSEPPPPTPPPCDAGKQGVHPGNDMPSYEEPHKYYILVKRSPGGWARRKRSSHHRFRMVPLVTS